METTKEFLDYEGLKDYHEKLKADIDKAIEENAGMSMSFDDTQKALVIG